MKISEINLYLIEMHLKQPFQTSFGETKNREIMLVELKDKETGFTGWGECIAERGPFYSAETITSCRHIITNFIWPVLKDKKIEHPSDFQQLVSYIRGNNMAKASVEDALWDLFGKIKEKPLAKLIKGTKKSIPSGISIGIQKDVNVLLNKISAAVEKKYKRVKIKIKPGWDVKIVKKIRDQYPDLPLMVDANSAYRFKDKGIFVKLDRYDLLMIEQPLQHYDIVDHSKLQKEINTPICLDESIRNVDDARVAIEIGACKIINVKTSRMGGISEALKLHKLAKMIDFPLWCGGSLETGIGRAKNLAVASLSTFVLPNDISESERYYSTLIIDKPFVLNEKGEINVPLDEPGLGVKIRKDIIKSLIVDHQTLT